MSYRTPEHREEAVRTVLDRLEKADRLVLTTHENADGDGCGSEVALAAWLRGRGKEAWIVNPTPYPAMYDFLVEDPSWIVPAGSADATEVCAGADLGVVLDTGEVNRIGRVKPLFDPLPLVIVDHHPPGDRPLEGVDLRDPGAAAAGELVYDLIRAGGGGWTPVIDRAIYVALLTDTGGFRFSNTSPGALRMAAELVERGVDPEDAHREVYGAAPLRRYRLLREALATLEVDPSGRVAWMVVPPEAYRRLGIQPDDLEGLVDYPRTIAGVEVGLLFRVTKDGSTKVSFRSNGGVDVNRLARQFDGGGHVKAAGARLAEPLETALDRVVDAAVRAVAGRGVD